MVNPFEPPRAPDQEPVGNTAEGLPEDAFSELVASAPAARWAAYLTLAGAIAGGVNTVVSVAGAANTANTAGAMAGGPVGIVIAIVFFVIFRRYARHAERLRTRQREDLAEVLDAQRAIFKTYGVLAILVLGLVTLVIGAGVIIGLATRGR